MKNYKFRPCTVNTFGVAFYYYHESCGHENQPSSNKLQNRCKYFYNHIDYITQESTVQFERNVV
jgi:hypothetical protein